jgi:hypothetical protein
MDQDGSGVVFVVTGLGRKILELKARSMFDEASGWQ